MDIIRVVPLRTIKGAKCFFSLIKFNDIISHLILKMQIFFNIVSLICDIVVIIAAVSYLIGKKKNK